MRIFVPGQCFSMQVAATQAADRSRLLDAASVEVQRLPAVTFSLSDNGMMLSLRGQHVTDLAKVAEAIQSQHGLAVTVGAPFAGYLRVPSLPAEADYTHKRLLQGEAEFARLVIRTDPSGTADSRMEIECSRESLPAGFQAGVAAGFQSVLQAEQDRRPPIVGIVIRVVDAAYHDEDSSTHAFEVAARCVLRMALDNTTVLLLEPFMNVTTTVSNLFVPTVVHDFTIRRGHIKSVREDGDAEILTALVPVANLSGYSEQLLRITKGGGHCNLEYSHHEPTPHQQGGGPENFPPAIGMRA